MANIISILIGVVFMGLLLDGGKRRWRDWVNRIPIHSFLFPRIRKLIIATL